MTIRADAHLPKFHRGAPPQLPVRVASTANLTIATGLNSGDTVDGVTLADGDRVLLKDQSTGSQNGIYIAGATPARAYDMEEGVAAMGAVIYVIAGTANGGKLFRNTNTTLPTIGSTALTFSEVSAAAGITIQDESSPLTTAATTLDFQGSGVTATGSGATKTITIPGGGVANVDVDIFTSTGDQTWTKPSCTMVRVICVGGGGGGGSGRKGTAGTVRTGGTGGAGGGMSVKDFLAADLGSTEKLFVGSGGTGGTSISASDTNGNPGNNGGASYFGNSVNGTPGDAKVVAGGGPNGAGGTNNTSFGNYAGTGNVQSLTATTSGHLSEVFNDMASNQDYFSAGGRSIISGTARPGSTQYACGGGGGGGCMNAATSRGGGAGGVPAHRAGQAAPTGGSTNGGDGSSGTSISGTDTLAPGGFGGGGGGGSSTGGSVGDGGAGGLYGGGGGGGGAGLNAVVDSGKGGDGANGIVVVISW